MTHPPKSERGTRTHTYPETTFRRYQDGTGLMTKVSPRKRMFVFTPDGESGVVIRALALYPAGKPIGPGSHVVTTRFGLNLIVTDLALSDESAGALMFMLAVRHDTDWERMRKPVRVTLEPRLIFDATEP